MIRGSCLCGGVRFEVDRAVGPFELCHCSRCRLLEGDPALRPDKHIFVELRSPWFEITDELPQLDKAALVRLRMTTPTS